MVIASFLSLAAWSALAAVSLGAGLLTLRRHRRGQSRSIANDDIPDVQVGDRQIDQRIAIRSRVLDVLGEAVLIMDCDGRVHDCNASALTLFDRHRSSIDAQHASTLRRFEGLDQNDPHRVALQHAVWVGEAWARQPDGGLKLCLTRVIAIRDAQARVTGFVESFRDVTADRELSEEFRDLLYGVRSYDPVSTTPQDTLRALQEELRLLGEAFRDLDLVLRKYERLLPALSADDPLTEAIAGEAFDARTAVDAVGVPALLEEIPRALTRVRGYLQQLATETEGLRSASRRETIPD
jgi:PAS domain-containing protein